MEDWTIIPQQGVGRLTFGLSAADVEALGAPYGPLMAQRQDAHKNQAIEDTIRQFGSSFSEEQIAALRATMAPDGAERMSEVRKHGDLVLEYEAEGLTSIMALSGISELSLDGQRLFELDPASLLRFLESRNGAPGRYRSTHAAFDNLAIAVSNFCELRSENDLILLTDADEAFAERAMDLRRTAYRPADEMESYRTLTVLADQRGG